MRLETLKYLFGVAFCMFWIFLTCSVLLTSQGDLQDGRHGDHDAYERGRIDPTAARGQNLQQDGQGPQRRDHAGGVQRGGQE